MPSSKDLTYIYAGVSAASSIIGGVLRKENFDPSAASLGTNIAVGIFANIPTLLSTLMYVESTLQSIKSYRAVDLEKGKVIAEKEEKHQKLNDFHDLISKIQENYENDSTVTETFKALEKAVSGNEEAIKGLNKIRQFSSYSRAIFAYAFLPLATIGQQAMVGALANDPRLIEEVVTGLKWIGSAGISLSHLYSAADVTAEKFNDESQLTLIDSAAIVANIGLAIFTPIGLNLIANPVTKVALVTTLAAGGKVLATASKSQSVVPSAFRLECLYAFVSGALSAVNGYGGFAGGSDEDKMLFNLLVSTADTLVSAARGLVDKHTQSKRVKFMRSEVIANCDKIFNAMEHQIPHLAQQNISTADISKYQKDLADAIKRNAPSSEITALLDNLKNEIAQEPKSTNDSTPQVENESSNHQAFNIDQSPKHIETLQNLTKLLGMYLDMAGYTNNLEVISTSAKEKFGFETPAGAGAGTGGTVEATSTVNTLRSEATLSLNPLMEEPTIINSGNTPPVSTTVNAAQNFKSVVRKDGNDNSKGSGGNVSYV